jgi:hypothetical protein
MILSFLQVPRTGSGLVQGEVMSTAFRRVMPWAFFAFLAVALTAEVVLAIEKPEYEVLKNRGDFEIRRYEAMIVAETRVDSEFEKAGNEAFRRLFKYISGDNTARAKISMTAPVVQEPSSEKIAMTAPVVQEADGSGWRVAFGVPKEYSWETAPQPNDARVSLRQVPERTVAAVRFSGAWGVDRFANRERELRAQLAEHGLQPVGEAVYARYNPPFTPWFLRRNEVMIPIAAAGDGS